MANPPPPYSNITGISRTIMKDNSSDTIADYNGNARPGEMVVDLTNNNIYVGNVNGGLTLINTGGGSGNANPAGPVGAIQYNAGGNLFGGSANLVLVGNTLTSGNIVPTLDNTYFLGNSTNRWANIWLGPGTIYMTDTGNTANVAQLTVSNGILQINGATGLQANLIAGNTTLTLSNSGNITLSPSGVANVVQVSNIGIALNGRLQHNGLDIEQPNYITVASAGTYAASTTNSTNILLYSGGAWNVTWTMPPSPVDGQICSWTNSSGSTSVFFITAGATLIPSISGPYSAGTKFRYIYRTSTSTWYDCP
jgi:hypothetical protein